jgi:hypothetical protein
VVLKAAHILPYAGRRTNHVQNGLLLRADLHTLFDLGLIAVDTRDYCLVVSEKLRGTEYEALAGSPLRLPRLPGHRPSDDVLDRHREWARLLRTRVMRKHRRV